MTLQRHTLGNFKPSALEKLQAKNRDDREDRVGNDNAHLAFIRRLPCCCCGYFKDRSDPHHLLTTGERGIGMRSTDRWTVPLCRPHHDELHRAGSRGEIRFFNSFGVYPHDLASSLWHASGDIIRMANIVAANRGK